jgi:hypothetical protein
MYLQKLDRLILSPMPGCHDVSVVCNAGISSFCKKSSFLSHTSSAAISDSDDAVLSESDDIYLS